MAEQIIAWALIEQQLSWKLLDCNQRNERVWTARWLRPDCRVVPTILKWVGRQEAVWYQTLQPRLGGRYGIVPVAMGSVPQPYVLLPEVGPSLKEVLIDLPPAVQRKHLDSMLCQLAEIHVTAHKLAKDWLQKGWIGEYAVSSSQSWHRDAIHQLERLADQGWCGARTWAQTLRAQSEAVLTHLSRWMREATAITVIHGDPHLGNWLLAADGTFGLIDWEYMSVGTALRDLTVFFQDVWDLEVQDQLTRRWKTIVDRHGWKVEDGPEFYRAFHAARFDNTLMMLGFEISQFYQGRLTRTQLEAIWETKLPWIEDAYAGLRPYL